MRGEHMVTACAAVCPLGIIPACAGSTVGPLRTRVTIQGSSPHARGAPRVGVIKSYIFRDHPRMRGEHHQGRGRANVRGGIIPACAGSTPSDLAPSVRVAGSSPHARGALDTKTRPYRVIEDHPRMRGEHSYVFRVGALPSGIIPACAGSTYLHPLQRLCSQDHPRMRGEHPMTSSPRQASEGSSPHARGALEVIEVLPRLRGIIPACAGSTLYAAFVAAWYFGSSPHARGAHLRRA